MKNGTVSKTKAIRLDPESNENFGSVCGLIPSNRDWSLSCDFIGNDIETKHIPNNQCGQACHDLPNCTHFVGKADVDNGTCFLKTGYITMDDFVQYEGDSVCGINVGHMTEALHIRWKEIPGSEMPCDFPGKDLKEVNMTTNVCSKECLNTQECSHYSW